MEFSLAGSNDSVDAALEILSDYVTSECNTDYNGQTMTCNKDSLIVSGKAYQSEKVRRCVRQSHTQSIIC